MSQSNNSNRNLSNLIEKFSKIDVIQDMEKDYFSNSPLELNCDQIDDNYYLEKATLSTTVLSRVFNLIKNNGISFPIVVRKKQNRYEVIFGRKRLLSCKYGGLKTIPAVVINVKNEEMLLMLLADNRDQREPNVIETALLCKELCESYHYSQSSIASITHQSRSQITNIMRLLNLPIEVIEDISTNKLSYGHAKAIASLPNQTVLSIVKEIYNYSLSVREVEHIAKRYKNSSSRINNEETALNRKYKAFTSIKKKSVTFTFESEDDKLAFVRDVLEIKD